jgi:hypothetical protein
MEAPAFHARIAQPPASVKQDNVLFLTGFTMRLKSAEEKLRRPPPLL